MVKKIDIKTVVTLAGVFVGLVGIYYMTTTVIPRMLVTMTKAAPATKISVANSKVIGAKLLAKADGQDKCVVNVFIMDAQGKGVKGKSVELSGSELITALNPVTDDNGKAGFEIVSGAAGQYKLTARVEGTELSQTVTVTFR